MGSGKEKKKRIKIGKPMIFTKYYKVTYYYNPKPDFYLRIGFFGRVKMIPKHGHSRLEKATEEETY